MIEAFSHGKVVLTSNGGALPELAQGFSPYIDPTDGGLVRNAEATDRDARRLANHKSSRSVRDSGIRPGLTRPPIFFRHCRLSSSHPSLELQLKKSCGLGSLPQVEHFII